MKTNHKFILAALAVVVVISTFNFFERRAESQRLGREAAVLVGQLSKSPLNSIMRNATVAALAMVAKRPLEALVPLIKIGADIWNHFSEGRELKARLDSVYAQLSAATRWEHIWATVAAVSAVVLTGTFFYARRATVPV